MQFKKPEWDRFDSMKLRLIVHHFNEEMQRYRPVAPPMKPLTWAQALKKTAVAFYALAAIDCAGHVQIDSDSAK